MSYSSNSPLPRTTPEQVGIPSSAIEAFLDLVEAKQYAVHSLMILRHGQVAAEGWWHPYNSQIPHHVYSFSKSVVSIAIGMAIDEGYLHLEDKIAGFFSDKITSKADKKIYDVTLRHLLTMSTGTIFNEVYVIYDGDWVAKYLNSPFQFSPGEKWHYNSLNTYMLSAILQQATGQSLCDYLRPRLFSPLGIGDVEWSTCPNGIEAGGWGLHLCTEDLAKFALLCLNRGSWEGRQLVSSHWIDEATAFQIDNSTTPVGEVQIVDNVAGYGYQFWMCRTKGIYRADGAFGQFAVIWPEKDMVILTTAGQGPQDVILDAIWDTIIYPMIEKDGTSLWLPSGQPVPAGESLQKRLRRLSLLPQELRPRSALEKKISGERYLLHQNLDSTLPFLFRAFDHVFVIGMRYVSLTFGPHACVLDWREGSYLNSIPITLEGGCAYSKINIDGHSYRVACHGSWLDEANFEVAMYFINTPHARLLRFHFLLNGEGVTLHFDEIPTLKNALNFVFDMKMASVPFQNRVLHFTDRMVLPVTGLRDLRKGKEKGK